MRRLALALLVALVACGPDSGPVEVAWDRDMCELCKMVISDARFAAEVRGGPERRVWKFDDLGDALHWLKTQPWGEAPETEIWVRDLDTGAIWLDARRAHYVRGVLTPMDYGFGAVAEARPDAVDFAAMRADVLSRPPTSRCDPPPFARTQQEAERNR